MYQGTHPSAIQSMQWIADALLRLMKTDSYPLITVKQICLEADLTRRTFYNCFDSKDEVLAWQLGRYLKDYLLPSPDRPEHSLEVMAAFYRHAFTDHREFFSLLIAQADHILRNEIASRLSASMERVAPTGGGDAYPYYVAYLSGGLSSLLIHWLRDERAVEEEELIRIQRHILSGEYYAASSMLGRRANPQAPSTGESAAVLRQS